MCENEAGCSEKWCAERCYNNATCDKVKIDVRRSMDIDIWLKAFDSDGLVFYWAKLKETGNVNRIQEHQLHYQTTVFIRFVSQEISEMVQFKWTILHSLVIKYLCNVLDNFHIQVLYSRTYSNCALKSYFNCINYYKTIINNKLIKFKPKNNHLDVFGEDIYIGGVPNDHLIPPVIPEMRKRFKGVIQRISINGQIFNNLFKVIIHYVEYIFDYYNRYIIYYTNQTI
ncbi:unnamed protein product [Anisakis simplex]|uniref:Uncharacterized protein n=1 Tax=Anisakis simplex TaxID=6269 RepID=A0A3P6NT74_ANISI|nr:unnamed protein product [Anisakis simplex]